jgi:hypothetical protein
MPYTVTKHFGDYSVIDSFSGLMFSRHTTLNRAIMQMEILQKLERTSSTRDERPSRSSILHPQDENNKPYK